MPSPDEVFGDIEADRAIREREIRFVRNAAQQATSDADRNVLLRTLVILTYAHLEGSCRFAFEAYASAVNSARVTCRQASYTLVAVTLGRLLAALRNPSSKHPIFARTLPDDSKLHLLAREREFLERLDTVMAGEVNLPDSAVDTESNLSSVVLRKSLYRLGLDDSAVEPHKGHLDQLVGVRNAIAHGDKLKVPSPHEADGYVASAFAMMQFVQYQVFDALTNRRYLRS